MNNKKYISIIIKQIFIFIFVIIKTVFKIIPLIFKIFGFTLVLIIKIFSNIGKQFQKLLRFSLTFKITFIYGLIFALLLFIISASILFSFRFFLLDVVRKDIIKESETITGFITKDLNIPTNSLNKIAQKENIEITIFDNNKEVIYFSKNNKQDAYFYHVLNSTSIINRKETQLMILNKQIYLNNSVYYIQIAKNLEIQNFYISILFFVLLATNSIGIIVTLIIGSKINRKMLKPIQDMTDTVKAITINDLDTRIDVSGSHDELKELAKTFNDMFDRIQGAYEKQNQFVSDASHELRTPISVIQGYANLLDRWGKTDKDVLQESIDAIKTESENMKDLIEKLLFLARGDKNLLKLEKEKFLLNELISEIIKETKLIDTKHKIISNINENIYLFADRKSIKQTLRIFIDNSIKFTPQNGTIIISASLQKNQIVISVQDTGIGIPEKDIPYVFDRFYRSDKSRSKESGGHGLGLAIAKWIIDKHGGNINLQSKINEGTKVSIFLPAK